MKRKNWYTKESVDELILGLKNDLVARNGHLTPGLRNTIGDILSRPDLVLLTAKQVEGLTCIFEIDNMSDVRKEAEERLINTSRLRIIVIVVLFHLDFAYTTLLMLYFFSEFYIQKQKKYYFINNLN